MDNVRALPRGHARGQGPRTWQILFIVALAALSGSGTLLVLNVTAAVMQDPAIISPAAVLDSLPPLLPRAETSPPAAAQSANAGASLLPAKIEIPRSPTAITADSASRSLLQAAVEEGAESQGGGMSISLIRLNDGATASTAGDEVWYSASLFKLSVLYEVERQIDAGLIHRDDRLVITSADLAEDLGTAWDLPFADDGSVSVEEALDAMVTHSDNASAVAFLRLVGSNNVNASLESLGLTSTSLTTTDLPTTANDMALLMKALVTGQGLSEEATQEVLGLLLDQETRSGIPSGLPETYTVGNKTGNWEGATHDVAFIVAPSGTYVLAILSDRSWGWDAVSQATWHIFNAIEPETEPETEAATGSATGSATGREADP